MHYLKSLTKFSHTYIEDEIFCHYCGNLFHLNDINSLKNKCNNCKKKYTLNIICELCTNSYIYNNFEFISIYSNVCNIYLNKIKCIIKQFKLYKLRKNIINYSNTLLDKYYNPTSIYINYIINNFDNYNLNSNNNTIIIYINSKNKLVFYKINVNKINVNKINVNKI